MVFSPLRLYVGKYLVRLRVLYRQRSGAAGATTDIYTEEISEKRDFNDNRMICPA